jgi:hypothetical protein
MSKSFHDCCSNVDCERKAVEKEDREKAEQSRGDIAKQPLAKQDTGAAAAQGVIPPHGLFSIRGYNRLLSFDAKCKEISQATGAEVVTGASLVQSIIEHQLNILNDASWTKQNESSFDISTRNSIERFTNGKVFICLICWAMNNTVSLLQGYPEWGS